MSQRKNILSNPYRSLAYITTAVTGFIALSAQVIWQRHLAILTGSEIRSLSLVVAIFLLGLAGGYYVFGLLTEKQKSRSLLLKYYGYVEFLTGIYIGFFAIYFDFLKHLSFHSPNLFLMDLLITFMALLLPTFLMGASIPLLTATLPDTSKEINTIHAQVYGWNSLGACFGALLSGFFLIPVFGLNLSLHMLGLLNILASLVFMWNMLEGTVKKQDEPPVIASSVPYTAFMTFIFFTGALIISFEIIFVRILNLSLGAGVYNFPMILSIFVGGLSLGSLSLKGQKLSMDFLIKQLLITLALLSLVFWFSPYWGIWLNHIRISLTSLPSNYFVFYLLVFLFLIIFLFPTVFFMGRLLPLVYSLLKKTKQNYGKICGLLYFVNTLGTVFGAIVIGYLAFYLLNLDIIFKINLYLLFLLTLSLWLYTKNKHRFTASVQLICLIVIGVILIFLPTKWNRTGHELGYFRNKTYMPKIHFKGLFSLPALRGNSGETLFFDDGPNTTVSLLHFKGTGNKELLSGLKQLFSYDFTNSLSYSLVVNGKSDSNSLGDFSTVFMMLPYLYSSAGNNLKTAVIGLGTGISAGVYAQLESVKSVDVLEISPFVAKAILRAPPELNFHVMKNPKVKTIITDAFKYFTKTDKKFDIIISEPSNPWVVGVENLFTLEFYKMISKTLNTNGVFAQWLHTYDINTHTIKIVLKTLAQVFPYAQVYQVGQGDMLIVTGSQEFNPLSRDKFNHPFVKKLYKAMGIKTVSDLYISQIISGNQFQKMSTLFQTGPKSLKHLYKTGIIDINSFLHLSGLFQSPINNFIQPQLIYRTNISMFLNHRAKPSDLINDFHPLDAHKDTAKMKAFENYKNASPEEWEKRCLPTGGFNFLCMLMKTYLTHWNTLQNEKEDILKRFNSYIFLRRQGLIPYDQHIMTVFFEENLVRKKIDFSQMHKFVFEKIQIKLYDEINKDVLILRKNDLINENHYKNFQKDLKVARTIHEALENSNL